MGEAIILHYYGAIMLCQILKMYNTTLENMTVPIVILNYSFYQVNVKTQDYNII